MSVTSGSRRIGVPEVELRIQRLDVDGDADISRALTDAQGGYRLSGAFEEGDYMISVHDDEGNVLVRQRFERRRLGVATGTRTPPGFDLSSRPDTSPHRAFRSGRRKPRPRLPSPGCETPLQAPSLAAEEAPAGARQALIAPARVAQPLK